jgi:hypothetical protein
MTRRTREFSLVLLGASALTAANFLWPEQNFEKRTEEQARQRVGGRTGVHVPLIWVHTSSYRGVGGRPAAVAGVSRGGFGSSAGRLGGGG